MEKDVVEDKDCQCCTLPRLSGLCHDIEPVFFKLVQQIFLVIIQRDLHLPVINVNDGEIFLGKVVNVVSALSDLEDLSFGEAMLMSFAVERRVA
jgi:hypothetical protein